MISQPTVVVDSGPLWLQYLTAAGTAGAALFAGWAAFTARSAARAAQAIVAVETSRDHRAEEETRLRQARRIAVDLSGQPVVTPDDRSAHDMHLVVINASDDPVLKVRLKIVVGDAVWGPQLIGTLAPGRVVQLTARLTTDEPSDNANAFVRFADVHGRYWVANARTPAEPDDDGLDLWVEQGRAFAQRPLTVWERGTITGAYPPFDLDEWRADLDGRTGGGDL